MDKKKLTQEMIDSGKSFEELGFKWISFLPYSDCEKCAIEIAERDIVADEDGVVYYNYNHEMLHEFFKAKYFSNIDTDDWDSEAGMPMLFDFLRKNSNQSEAGCLQAGMDIVSRIVNMLFKALEKKHENTSSLAYKVAKMFESVIGNEDVIEKLAHSREVNETMIDMVRAYREQKENRKADVIPMTMFAKK